MTVGTVSTEGSIGTQFVLLLDRITGEILDQTTPGKDINGEYQYQFEEVPAGNYQILGGSDIDNDLLICQLGESCGGFPVLNKLSDIIVTDSNITDLDFVSGVLSNYGATSTTASTVSSIKLQQPINNKLPNPKEITGVFKE